MPIHGYCVDLTTNMALDFIKKHKNDGKPFLVMCQFKAPHRTWMPAARYLHLYDDVTIPEPPTLFDDYKTRPLAAKQRMEIGRDLHWGYDLKVPGMEKGGWGKIFDYNRMTPAQRKAWDAAYGPKNKKFKEKLYKAPSDDWAIKQKSL